MGIISDVKCGKCDRRYSGLRGRCPYCGARRGKRGKHANDVDNSKGKLIIGLLLILVLMVAVVVLIVTSMNKDKTQDTQQPNEQQQITPDVSDEGVTSVEGTPGTTDTQKPAGTESNTSGSDTNTSTDGNPTTDGTTGSNSTSGITGDDANADTNTTTENTATGAVTSVDIMWRNGVLTDFTANVGQVYDMEYATTPADSGNSVEWSSSDESVFTVLQSGELTIVGSGKATLTLTVDGVTAECIVRVN